MGQDKGSLESCGKSKAFKYLTIIKYSIKIILYNFIILTKVYKSIRPREIHR